MISIDPRAGVMSTTTCWLNVAGNLARLYTTFVLTHDLLLGAGMLIQFFLNTILLVQARGTQELERTKREAAALRPLQDGGTS